MAEPLDKIKIPVLERADQFLSWRRKLDAVLLMQDLYGIATGSEEEPSDDDTAEDKEIYVKKKQLCFVRILLSLGEEAMNLTLDVKHGDAKGLYERVISWYTATTEFEVQRLKEQFWTLSQGESESRGSYVNRARTLFKKLASSGHAVTEDDKARKFLSGLSEKWDMEKRFLAAREEQPDFEEAARYLFRQDGDSDSESGKPTTDDTATALHTEANHTQGYSRGPRKARKRKKEPRRCHMCNSIGHIKYDCPIIKELVRLQLSDETPHDQGESEESG